MKIIRTTAIVFWLLPLAAAGFSCAPRGDVERPAPVESGGDEDALVRGDAPRSIGAQGALDRMNQDKKTADDLLANGRYQEAADLVAPWAARKAADPQVYAMLARAQWKLGRHDDAVKNYEESLRLDYSSAYTHLELAEMLLEIGKSGRALTEFELAVQFGKNDPLPHYNYGLALYDMGRVDDALAHWENAYTNNPKDPRYAEAMGIGLSERDPAKALVYFEAAQTHGADHPGFHNNFGLLLERIGDYARAESEFKKAIAGEPGNRGYRQNLALSYMKSKQPELAVPLWQALHGEDPAGPDLPDLSRTGLSRDREIQGCRGSPRKVGRNGRRGRGRTRARRGLRRSRHELSRLETDRSRGRVHAQGRRAQSRQRRASDKLWRNSSRRW